ncbi:MAG: 2-hydroxyacid dehydrogenase [Verrucomicrobiota bacterium]
MKIAVFDTHQFDRKALTDANKSFKLDLTFFDARLKPETAVLASGFDVVCVFVNDHLDRDTLLALRTGGVKLIALRCAGFNNVDLRVAKDLALPVVRVPEYSPFAVAEHAVALMQVLNRKIHRAYGRVREGNFSLDGLVGFDVRGKTVGVIGTGKIGRVFAQIMHGFGCSLLAFDAQPDESLVKETGITYVKLPQLLAESDVISLHVPLTPKTHHLIDDAAISQMKKGAMIINTSRGGLIDTKAMLKALKSGHVSAAGLDVYEEEEAVFFQDLSGQVIQDDVLARLLTFPNVIITSHQAFLTNEALSNIATMTLANIQAFVKWGKLQNEVKAD